MNLAKGQLAKIKVMVSDSLDYTILISHKHENNYIIKKKNILNRVVMLTLNYDKSSVTQPSQPVTENHAFLLCTSNYVFQKKNDT